MGPAKARFSPARAFADSFISRPGALPQVSTQSTGATGLAGRYATALFELADGEGVLDRVAGDLAGLGAMIVESADLDRLVHSPVTTRVDQGKVMAALLGRIEAADLTKRFLGLLVEKRRLAALPGIVSAYQYLLAAKRGEATAEVVSAQALSPAQMQALNDSLAKAVGSKVTVDTRVDPGLIGGLVVKVGSRMVDSSLRTKLSHMRLAMKGVG